MISTAVFKTLDTEERKLWHSHVFEVKSGMLIMPGPNGLPTGIWEEAETKEMEQVVGLYGKTYHFWQVDRGDKLPLGPPQLMSSFTSPEQFKGLKDVIRDRDRRYGVDHEAKAEKRAYIEEPEIHPGNCHPIDARLEEEELTLVVDADAMWKGSSKDGGKTQEMAGTTTDGA